MTTESDIYSEIDPPKSLFYLGITIAGLAFLGTAEVRDDAAPLFAALSVGALCMMVGLMWPLRHRKMLWVILTAIAALHGAAVTSLRFPHEVRYGIAFAPLVALDIVIFWKLTVWLLRACEKLLNR